MAAYLDITSIMVYKYTYHSILEKTLMLSIDEKEVILRESEEQQALLERQRQAGIELVHRNMHAWQGYVQKNRDFLLRNGVQIGFLTPPLQKALRGESIPEDDFGLIDEYYQDYPSPFWTYTLSGALTGALPICALLVSLVRHNSLDTGAILAFMGMILVISGGAAVLAGMLGQSTNGRKFKAYLLLRLYTEYRMKAGDSI